MTLNVFKGPNGFTGPVPERDLAGNVLHTGLGGSSVVEDDHPSGLPPSHRGKLWSEEKCESVR